MADKEVPVSDTTVQDSLRSSRVESTFLSRPSQSLFPESTYSGVTGPIVMMKDDKEATLLSGLL